jgi:hypothetical protein
MKIKIILGIALPLAIILAFVILSTFGTKVEVIKTFQKSVNGEELFGPNSKDYAILGEITLKNIGFVSTKYSLSRIYGCTKKQTPYVGSDEVSIIFMDSDNKILQNTIDLAKSKIEKIYIMGRGTKETPLVYNAYNKLILYESDSYISCWEIGESMTWEDYPEIAEIQFIKNCEDPDNLNITTKTTINFEGQNFTDYCLNDKEIIEYSCMGENFQIKLYKQEFRADCQFLGFNKCLDGACVN